VLGAAVTIALLFGIGSAMPGIAGPAAAVEGGHTECAAATVEYGDTLSCVTYFTTDTFAPLLGHANTTAVNGTGDLATVTPAWCDTGWDNFTTSCAFTVTADIIGPSMTIQTTWSGYYLAPFNPTPLVVDLTRAPFDVGVADATRVFGEANPDFEMLYYGFKLDDDASIMGTPGFTTDADETSLPGAYDVWPADGVEPQSGYYQLNTGTAGTLTISAADAPLTIVLPETVVFAEGNLPVDLYDEYGRFVVYAGTGACEYNSGAIEFLSAGTCAVEMTAQAGDTGYDDALASATIEVQPFAVQVAWESQPAIRFGTAVTDDTWNAEVGSYFTGTWSYAVPELTVGVHTITASFTPDDPNYTTGSASIDLRVLSASLPIGEVSDGSAIAGHPYVLDATFAECHNWCTFRWFVDGILVGSDYVSRSDDNYFTAVSEFAFSYTAGAHDVRVEAMDNMGFVAINGLVLSVAIDASAAEAAADAAAEAAARAAADAAAEAAAAAASEAAARASLPDTATRVPSGSSSLPLLLIGFAALLTAGFVARRKVRAER
jgi:hypothetical protein